MKKIFSILVLVLMMASFGVVSFAAQGAFVVSPSGNQAPILVKAENESEACEATVKICSYADRATLSEDARLAMEAAYASIVATEDVGTLSSSLKNEAATLGITTADMAVSDLFDISMHEEDHEGHGAFDVVIKPTSVKNVVGVLHYTDGAWEYLDATVGEEGELSFTTDTLSPFAIVVHNGTASAPASIPTEFIIGIGGVAAVLVAVFVGIEVNKRRW